jgi:Fic family protein
MEAFTAWLAGAELHPALLAAEAHYRFAKIHPFVDGNGRTARLLMNLVLLRHGYPLTVIPAEQRADYIKVLDTADTGDPEPFQRLMLACVERSLDLSLSVND